MNENILTDDEQKILRSSGIIIIDEVAIRVGDLIVAEHVITQKRRVINGARDILSESNKRLLKG
jgi:hypothetical protein